MSVPPGHPPGAPPVPPPPPCPPGTRRRRRRTVPPVLPIPASPEIANIITRLRESETGEGD